MISSAPFTPVRRVGSLLSKPVRMLRASAPNSGPKSKGSLSIFSYILSVISVSREQDYETGSCKTYRHRKVASLQASRIKEHRASTNQWFCLRIVSLKPSVACLWAYYILVHSESLGQDTLAFHKTCWFSRCPSCLACTSRNHIAQYAQYSQVKCSPALDRCVLLSQYNSNLMLDTPVDDIQLVQMFQCKEQFRTIEAIERDQ